MRFSSSSPLSILSTLTLIHRSRAAPASLGISSTSAMAGLTSSSPNALAIVLPMVFAAFLLLSLAACCCAYRRSRSFDQVYGMRSSTVPPGRRARFDVAKGLGILPPSEGSAARYQQIPCSPVSGDVPPPYTLRQLFPLLNAAEDSSRSPSLYSVPSIYVESPRHSDGCTLSPPSPLVCRTGSPVLHIWAPSSPPSASV
jgi:preprotein translocase subunit SecG